ncbi:MAG: hypothetical protein QW818_00150 [Candidatus Aenigmatarchaeota archaeon]|nr:hypothetical protein [Candidatus Aenigmarchaeota archaeon]
MGFKTSLFYTVSIAVLHMLDVHRRRVWVPLESFDCCVQRNNFYTTEKYLCYTYNKYPVISMSFVIIFDIPKVEKTERVRIHRELVRSGAELIQDSFWRSDNLKFLIDIGMRIRKIGGSATILEEKFLF